MVLPPGEHNRKKIDIDVMWTAVSIEFRPLAEVCVLRVPSSLNPVSNLEKLLFKLVLAFSVY